MRLEIITHHACPHCREYARIAVKYADVVEYDIQTYRKRLTGVPYSYLYDGNTLIAEWQGGTLEPLFNLMEGPKMKIKFLVECHDKHTLKTYKKGTMKVFPEARAREIINAGVAVEVKPKNDKDND